MTLTEQQVREILAGCEGVTPGPWTACLHVGIPDAHIRAEIHGCNICNVIEGTESARGRVSHEDMQANAQHIARLDHQTVSALCAMALDSLSRRAADAAVRDAALEEAAQVVRRAATAMEKVNAHASTPRAASAGYTVIAGLEAIEIGILALKSKASP